MFVDFLEPRRFLTSDIPFFQYDPAHVSAAAGEAGFSLYETLRTTPTGTTYLLGRVGEHLAVAALKPNGRLNTNFGESGTGIALSPWGKPKDSTITNAGSFLEDSTLVRDDHGFLYMINRAEVVKLRPDGSRDLNFGRRGAMRYASPRTGLVVCDAITTSDNRVLIAAKTLHQGQEKYYLYEITQSGAKLAWHTNRPVGSDLTWEPNHLDEDAMLRPAGDGFAMIFRKERLTYISDPDSGGLPYVTQHENVLALARFDSQLNVIAQPELFSSIEIPNGTDIRDMRVVGQTVRVALSGLHAVQFVPDKQVQRKRRGSDGAIDQVRFFDDNTIVALQIGQPDRDLLYTVYKGSFAFNRTPETPLATIVDPADDAINRELQLQPDGTVLATQSSSRGGKYWQLIRPGTDGPKMTHTAVFYYGHVPYQHIRYDAPNGISKATVDHRWGPMNDLIITAPSGEKLISGTSGHYRDWDNNGYGVRYWINGPGGSWGPEDNGVYTVQWRPGSVSDALGVVNSGNFAYEFTYDYSLNHYG